ncbi:hypothetical protein Tco_0934704, partial [Tanacetum coccineum]
MASEKSKRTTFILINVGSIKDDLKWTYDTMSCLTQVHVVCTWVLDLYYGVHGFDSFTRVDYSSSDHFSSDDSSRDSSSSSSSETSLDSSADALSDYASSRSSSDHSLPTPSLGMRPSYHLCSLVPSIHRSSAAISDRPTYDSSFASPSRKRSRSPIASIPLYSPTLGALS